MIIKLYLNFYLEICLKCEEFIFKYYRIIYFSEENNKLVIYNLLYVIFI